ncbi:AMP-binding protein [Streptococcus gordonii]|uniref:AMP-binding protein n=1 Tax=Streptococcus gordonii TaxID=1302 RepID=UPI001CBE0858|nr:AMP-binding protein [Streptococcus gordonii]MBZ2135558.1 AMP-binding protein [Streptococcus gordonii]
MNLYDFIFREVNVENIAIVNRDEKITYYDLFHRIEKQYRMISSLSEVVILPVQDPTHMIINLFAALKRNKKVIILNSDVEIEHIELNDSSIILENDLVTIHKREKGNSKKLITNLSDINILTSGTTGKPKLCALPSHSIEDRVTMLYKNYLENLDKVIEGLVFPVFSITALTIQIFPTLMKGGTLLLIEKIEQIPQCLTRYEIDFLGLTPTIFKLMCAKNIDIFNSLGNLFLGGEMIDFPKIKEIAKKLTTTNIFIG